MQYLEVIFGDNDFGLCVKDGLKRVWEWTHSNNAHLLANRGQDLHKIFQKLHQHGALKPLLERAIYLEYLYWTVEFATRGLYWDHGPVKHSGCSVQWDKTKIAQVSAKEVAKPITNYLDIELHFRKSGAFKEKWRNSEHAYLNLETGEADTF